MEYIKTPGLTWGTAALLALGIGPSDRPTSEHELLRPQRGQSSRGRSRRTDGAPIAIFFRSAVAYRWFWQPYLHPLSQPRRVTCNPSVSARDRTARGPLGPECHRELPSPRMSTRLTCANNLTNQTD